MSAWSTIHIVPAEDPDWVPTKDVLADVLAHLGVTTTGFFVAYSVPVDYSGSDAPEEHRVMEDYTWEVSVAEALDAWEHTDAVSIKIGFEAPEWNKRLCDSLYPLPLDITGNFLPDNLSVTLGPFTILSPACDRVIGRYSFSLELSGSGMPPVADVYLARVREDPHIMELLSHLENKTGKRWAVMMGFSY